MIGKPDRFGRVHAESVELRRARLAVFRQRSARMASPRFSFTSRPTITVASEAIGDGPE